MSRSTQLSINLSTNIFMDTIPVNANTALTTIITNFIVVIFTFGIIKCCHYCDYHISISYPTLSWTHQNHNNQFFSSSPKNVMIISIVKIVKTIVFNHQFFFINISTFTFTPSPNLL